MPNTVNMFASIDSFVDVVLTGKRDFQHGCHPIMPYTKLTITVPESVWIGEVSRTYPDTEFRVLAATTCSPSGVVQLEVHSTECETICEEIRGYNSVTELTVFEAGSKCCRVQVETTVPLLLMAIEGSGVPLETPFEIRDGGMELEAMLPQHRLSALSDQFERFDIDFTVDEIRQNDEADSLLTDRQHWLVGEAIERGYYDTPRGCTLTGLAESVDLAKSTCSEVLHRAEGQVLKQHILDSHDLRTRAVASGD